MIDVDDVQRAIAELERRELTFPSCAKLADLYSVLDHAERVPAHSRAAAPSNRLELYGSSDFLRAVEGKRPEDVLLILDELMDTLHIVRDRVYAAVLAKLDRL